jgi:hypothetical protein
MHWMRVTSILVIWAASRAMAQDASSERPLPVAGTLIYNVLFLSRPADYHGGGIGARFAGRFAVRVRERTYVGIGVGSWAQAPTGQCAAPVDCGTFADYWSEAVVHQLYAQHTPSSRFPGWARVGVGLAKTTTLVPGGGVIGLSDRWRAAVTAGLGGDWRLERHLFLTPSIDYTALPGVDPRGPELRYGLALGIGVTIR